MPTENDKSDFFLFMIVIKSINETGTGDNVHMLTIFA